MKKIILVIALGFSFIGHAQVIWNVGSGYLGNTDAQKITLTGNVISLENGGTVDLSGIVIGGTGIQTTDINTFDKLNAIVADQNLVDINDVNTFPFVQNFSVISATGQIGVRGGGYFYNSDGSSLTAFPSVSRSIFWDINNRIGFQNVSSKGGTWLDQSALTSTRVLYLPNRDFNLANIAGEIDIEIGATWRTGGTGVYTSKEKENAGKIYRQKLIDGYNIGLEDFKITTGNDINKSTELYHERTATADISVNVTTALPDSASTYIRNESQYKINLEGGFTWLDSIGYKPIIPKKTSALVERLGDSLIIDGYLEWTSQIVNLYPSNDAASSTNENNLVGSEWLSGGGSVTLTSSIEQIQAGSYSLKVTDVALDGSSAYFYQDIPVVAGGIYAYSFWGYEPTAGGGAIELQVRSTNTTGSTQFNSITVKDAWQEKTGTFTAVADGVVRIQIVAGNTSGQYGFADNYLITKTN